jgi:hypothetical protein
MKYKGAANASVPHTVHFPAVKSNGFQNANKDVLKSFTAIRQLANSGASV